MAFDSRFQSDHASLAGSGPRSGRAVLVGCGNIGSHAAIYLATRGRVASLCIVDRDVVEARNLKNQFYATSHVGAPKAEAAAEQLRRLAPDLEVESIVTAIEDLPLGVIADADLCLAGLDTLRARQVLANDYVYRCGIPLIDGAVDGTGDWYGTVQVIVPGGGACVECKWTPAFYRQLAREMPCGLHDDGSADPNQASAALGAAVAGVMTDEALRILHQESQPHSFEIAMDVRQGRRLVSRLCPARHCRFDHQMVEQRVSLEVPFAEATVHHLRQAALDWAVDERPQLEFRRNLFGSGPLEPTRWQTPRSLIRFAGRLLSNVGLTARDRIRLQTPSRSALLELNAATPSRPGD